VGIIEKAAGRLAQPGSGATAAPPKATSATAPEVPAQAATPEQFASASKATTSKRVELNLARLHEAGMVTPDGERSSVAEEFRAIKRSLITHALEKKGDASRPGNLIMVTSALPGEGKTFCSINLAISIAMELDHTVLLVDADVARPSVLKRLGIEADAGLMNVLLERNLDVADVMLKTNIDTLSILPSGSRHRHATELLASQAMNKLLHEIAHRYSDRIVIFDSPPLLVTTESRALATRMGQIVMVVEGEKTTQYALKNALRQIESCPNINLIYNKAKAFRGLENYGYYYS
jgi:exopolysaccharide/PEP-CTERM locus tyrosine autokinase